MPAGYVLGAFSKQLQEGRCICAAALCTDMQILHVAACISHEHLPGRGAQMELSQGFKGHSICCSCEGVPTQLQDFYLGQLEAIRKYPKDLIKPCAICVGLEWQLSKGLAAIARQVFDL